MNSKELYRKFLVDIQKVYELDEATVITDWVFEHVAGLKKTDLIKNPLQQVPAPVIKKISDKKELLLQYQPVQYVIGETTFCGLQFQVNDKVLIPRPETEELTQLIINSWRFETKQVSVLDVGTGSGCIAVTIKKNLPSAKVMALDASYDALEVAHKNAVANKVNVQINLLDFLDEQRWPELLLFDIIVSNPPYIPLREKEKLDKNVVEHEPHKALFVPDENPLLFYEKIARFGRSHLNYNGKIYLETHEDYAKEVAALFKVNYREVMIKKDMFGKERMVIASF
ncbi:MAG: peptide chain release factor N(5)-glutamine methyltransferase [Ferruginibacter sp.]